MCDTITPDRPAVVLGLGVTGQAVTRALRRRGYEVVAFEDRPTPAIRDFAADQGIRLLEEPDALARAGALTSAGMLLPSPGVPDSHPAFLEASELDVKIVSEFDLARWWDERPIVAITGTDGKTSVTLLTVAILAASGIHAVAVGNTETPLVDAIDDPMIDVFVVEASSFRLGHSDVFAPTAAAWLNFSPDHLDVHASLELYERSKAAIWAHLPEDGLAVASADDEIVQRHVPADRDVVLVRAGEISASELGDARAAHVIDGSLVLDGTALMPVSDLSRAFEHDVFNALVAATLALRVGATHDGVRSALAGFELPPHRIQYVTSIDGVAYFNDSKATVPHAVTTAVNAFDSVVLIAGGKNKGLDLGPLAEVVPRLRAVVALGAAAPDIEAVFRDHVDVEVAPTMDEAVFAASRMAEPGDTILLSPGCASFDAYSGYDARGDHFMQLVRELEESS